MSLTFRLLGLIILLVATTGLCVQYAKADLWSQPKIEDISTNPATIDGEKTLLFGKVLAVNDDYGIIKIANGPIKLTVENVPPSVITSVKPGGSIQVYGTLREESEVIVADEIVIDFRHRADRIYVYAASIFGGLIAAGYFLYHWRVDWHGLRFTSRGSK